MSVLAEIVVRADVGVLHAKGFNKAKQAGTPMTRIGVERVISVLPPWTFPAHALVEVSMRISICPLMVSVLMFLTFVPAGMVADPPVPRIDDIVDGIKASENHLFQLDGFLVNCERKKSEDITLSRYSGGYANVEFVVAKKEGQWFTSKAFTEVGKEDEYGRNMVVRNGKQIRSPLEPLVTHLKSHLLLEWRQSGNMASVERFTEGRNMHQCFDYFRHIGWNLSRYVIEAQNQNYEVVAKIPSLGDDLEHPFLPEFLENNKGKYTVQSTQEEIDGFPCWVVEYPGMDKFWVDPKHGYAVRKRIYHWAPGKPKKFSILNQEWKEVHPGLWLPHKQLVDKYASIVSEDEEIWDKVTARMYYEVKEIFINNVPDTIFEVKLPIGLQVIDMVRDTEYTIFDPNSDPFVGPIEQARKVNRFVIRRSISIIIGSIFIFIAIWLLLRNTEKK